MNMKKSVIGTTLAMIFLATTSASAISSGNTAALKEIRATAGSLCQLTDITRKETEIRVNAAAKNILRLGVGVSGSYYNRKIKGAAIDKLMKEIDPEAYFECNLKVLSTLSGLLLVSESKSSSKSQQVM